MTATPTQDFRKEVKAWDSRMATLQGEFVANSKSIAWMLELMQRTAPVDAETTQAIQGGIAKNLSEGAEVEQHRQFVADAMPHRQQRASVVSDHLQNDIPRLQAVLERIGFVITEANQQQTQILGTMMGGVATQRQYCNP